MDIGQGACLRVFRRPLARRANAIVDPGGFEFPEAHQANARHGQRRPGRFRCRIADRARCQGDASFAKRRQAARGRGAWLAPRRRASRQAQTGSASHHRRYRTAQHFADVLRRFVLHPQVAQKPVLLLPAGNGRNARRRTALTGCRCRLLMGVMIRHAFRLQKKSPAHYETNSLQT